MYKSTASAALHCTVLVSVTSSSVLSLVGLGSTPITLLNCSYGGLSQGSRASRFILDIFEAFETTAHFCLEILPSQGSPDNILSWFPSYHPNCIKFVYPTRYFLRAHPHTLTSFPKVDSSPSQTCYGSYCISYLSKWHEHSPS